MTTPRRRLDAAELLHGEDHEFIVNMYLAVLRRWPDEGGYRHFMRQIANRPERRAEALREIAGSEEARRLGHLVEIPADPQPGDPGRARDAVLDIRTEVLQAEIGKLRQALELLSGVGGEELAGLQRDLAEAREAEWRAELNAVRRELREAMAGLKPPAPAGTLAPEAALAEGLARLFTDYVEARLGGLEQRLAALEARLPVR